jgi:hypothetical protein
MHTDFCRAIYGAVITWKMKNEICKIGPSDAGFEVGRLAQDNVQVQTLM